jgi:Cache domain
MLSKLTSNGLFRLPGAGAQRRMLVLAFAAFAAVALCSVIVIVQTRSSIQAQAFRDQAAVGQSYALVVQEYLDGSRSVLEGLAQVPAVRAPLNLDAIRPELRGIPQEMDVERRAAIAGTILGSGRVHTMVMVAPGGQLYMVEPYASQLAFPTPKLLTPPIERALATGQTVFSDVLINALTHTPSVALQVPIKDDDGVVLGLLGTTLDLGRLAEVAKGVRPGQTGSVMLVDRHGLPIVYSDTARSQQPRR